MDFVDALKVLIRRWRIVLVGALITMAAAAAAILFVPTNYQASGQLVLLLPPQATGAATPTNPYLNLEPGLTVAGSLIASTLATKDSQRSVEDAGFTSKYTVGIVPGTGPVIEVKAEDTDPVMAVRTRDEVIRRLENELERIQVEESAPKRQLIHARTNGTPDAADPLPGSKIRALAVIGALGVTVTFIVAFTVDRRRTKSAGSAPEEEPETDAEDDDAAGSTSPDSSDFAWGDEPSPVADDPASPAWRDDAAEAAEDSESGAEGAERRAELENDAQQSAGAQRASWDS